MIERYKREEKDQLIKDIIKYCREKKEKSVEDGIVTGFFNAIIGDELWDIHVSAIDNVVRTSAIVKPEGSNKRINYCQKKWGGDGKRWSTELREFLEREILKQ